MDAKPHRPMRALRIRDENAPPQLPGGKSIHQRNKSTPALSALAQVGGLKAAATKRTVFADVSNTARQLVVKDDLQLPGKTKDATILKDPAIVSAKELVKSAALLRPAQRPLTTTTSKTNTTNGSDSVAPTLSKLANVDISLPTTNIRKAIAKKVTTVFKESHSDPIAAPNVVPVPTRQPLVARTEPVPNTSRVPTVAESAAKALAQETTTSLVAHKHHNISKPNKEIAVEPREHIYEEKVTKVQVEVKQEDKYEYLDALEEQARVLEQERNEEIAKSGTLDNLEQEEYWDEEEEDEYFDADGYTTARSLRLRGDNTTGGVTIVLAPRVTTKSQRELEAAREYVEARRTVEDIEDEQWDMSMVAEYSDEIFDYMRDLEERMKPNASYMDHQAEIQWSMRSVLMDWIVQVHNRFSLLPETLFLAVNYVDRFLSSKVVSLGKLQLVGATALFVAAKYEEINCPSVSEIVYMVDGAYTVEEILKAERFMLSMLQFELGWPGPMSFLRRISKADDYDLETRTLSKYFLEITVMDERFVGCAPSFIAAGAHCLARFLLKKGDWSQAHVHYSGYTMAQLRPLVTVIFECCEAPQKHHAAVFEKYSDKRYRHASIYVETEIGNNFQLPFVTRDSLAGHGHSQSWRRK
ncbi:G2/mitotic-specific cyclin 3 [Massariosphaeria phaeospora]|uniref:G2/mitotic-specific cyclin 3 n=1 Tax=Massariosphaeria phaeospora TaxID=100035 RepID=A0A7C8M2A8_9PLEO|nr:G2/mitotic-specific cyclin 3 [Massariosphaeria phaeospora]